jgi:hypothetical protein
MLARSPRLAALALAALATLAPACSGGGAKAPSVDYGAKAIADAGVHLQGAWVLQSFTPATSLEPMLNAMLQFQFGRMIARFDGQRMVADSPGIHVERRYQIREASGDQFKVTTFDDQGVPYDADCMFQEDTLQIVSTSDPWRGLAVLKRTVVAPAATSTTTGMPGMPLR